MWPDGRLLGLLEIEIPVIQAPMAGADLPALRAARSDETAVTNVMTGHPARGVATRFMRETGPMAEAPAHRPSCVSADSTYIAPQ